MEEEWSNLKEEIFYVVKEVCRSRRISTGKRRKGSEWSYKEIRK